MRNVLDRLRNKTCMLVHGTSFNNLTISNDILKSPIRFIQFSSFSPNPRYEDIVEGIRLFQQEECDAILAVGGGSAIDVAKCIKLFSSMGEGKPYYEQSFSENDVPLFVIPTTAGTGSEATQFAVIYVHGEKLSISHQSLLPQYVILEPSVLETLPLYQKKCSMLDALFQALEAWWSVNSTEQSIEYSQQAIALFLESMEGYLGNTQEGNEGMLLASNWAGKAINITRTTAPHAMSYKITTLFGFPHGHSVALAFPHVWKYMIENLDRCIDPRGKDFLEQVFTEMAVALGTNSVSSAIGWIHGLLKSLEITGPETSTEEQLRELVSSVDTDRLGNLPVAMDEQAIRRIYMKILGA